MKDPVSLDLASQQGHTRNQSHLRRPSRRIVTEDTMENENDRECHGNPHYRCPCHIFVGGSLFNNECCGKARSFTRVPLRRRRCRAGRATKQAPSTLLSRLVAFLLMGISFRGSCCGFANAASCTVCPDRQSVPLPDKAISIPDPALSFIKNCGMLDSLVSSVLADETVEECQQVRSISSVCGCPIPLGAEACYLCSLGNSSAKEVSHMTVGNPEVVIDPSPFDWMPEPTCEIVEAYLHSRDGTDPVCLQQQNHLFDVCGCVTAHTTTSNKTDSNKATPSNTDTVLLSPENSCLICPDGSPVTNVDFDVAAFIPKNDPNLPQLPEGMVPTCGAVQTFLSATGAISPDSEQCQKVQLLQGICGCPRQPNTCDLCPKDDFIPFPNATFSMPDPAARRAPEMSSISSIGTVTCGEMSDLLGAIPQNSDECFFAQTVAFMCGCNEGVSTYLEADTIGRQAALAWVPRVTAILSLFCSVSIMFDIMRSRRQKRKPFSVYHEIMLMMSMFDVCGSFAFAFTSLPIPAIEFGLPSPFYGAQGNDATCTAQGFFIQMGFVGVLYNLVLSVYYVLVIRNGLKDPQLKRARLWFHAPPVLVGTILALAGIPFYGPIAVVCHIARPPLATSLAPLISLVIVPIAVVVFVATVNMGIVVWKVRQTRKAGDRWNIRLHAQRAAEPPPSAETKEQRIGRKLFQGVRRLRISLMADSEANSSSRSSAAARQERAVLWQALTYLFAFYASWPLYMAASLIDFKTGNYGFYLAAFTLSPMQGVWNALVYFRVRLTCCVRDKRKKTGGSGSEFRQKSSQTSEGFFSRWIRVRLGSESLAASSSSLERRPDPVLTSGGDESRTSPEKSMAIIDEESSPERWLADASTAEVSDSEGPRELQDDNHKDIPEDSGRDEFFEENSGPLSC